MDNQGPENMSVVVLGVGITKIIQSPCDCSLLSCQKVGFSTMSAIALAPLTCYTHPNQLRSLLKYPNVCLGNISSAFFCRRAFGSQTWLKTRVLPTGKTSANGWSRRRPIADLAARLATKLRFYKWVFNTVVN